MTPTQHAELAMHHLVLARITGNARGIAYWLTRVDYWSERVIQEGLK